MSYHGALKFVHPDVDAGEPGLQLSATGGLAMAEDEDAIRQDLLLLLFTRPGERVLRPEYGCELHRLVFSPLDDNTAGLVMHYVRQAIERWEPRIEELAVDAAPAHDDRASRLIVRVEYRVRRSQRRDGWSFSLDLGEGAPR